MSAPAFGPQSWGATRSTGVQRARWDQSSNEYDQTILWNHEQNYAFFNRDTEADLTDFYARPASRHSGGFVMTFVDGRVVFVNENLDRGVYNRMMTSRGRDFIMPGLETKGSFQTSSAWTDSLTIRQTHLVPVSEADLNK